MASLKILFDKFTIIRPSKIRLLGLDGLEKELLSNVHLFAETLWNSLPFKEEYSIPSDYDNYKPLGCAAYRKEDFLRGHLSSINDSINIISTLLDEIQKRAKVPQKTKLKRYTKMPQSLRDCEDSFSMPYLPFFSGLSDKSNIEVACEEMGIPCSIDNLIDYGELLFCAYKQAASMIEDFVYRTASMIMTEDEIKELTIHNEFAEVYFPNYSKDEIKLKELCNNLVNYRYLHVDTNIDDFVYFFSGSGNVPNNNLSWIGTNVTLGIFLDNYFLRFKKDIPSKWKKAQIIFHRKNLRQSVCNARYTTNSDAINKLDKLFASMF